MTSTETKIGPLYLVDYGEIEYLDGSKGRFCVRSASGPIAYFLDRDNAILFAEVLSFWMAERGNSLSGFAAALQSLVDTVMRIKKLVRPEAQKPAISTMAVKVDPPVLSDEQKEQLKNVIRQFDPRYRRIWEIDKMFEEAKGWGSWMVSAGNERKRLVEELNAEGWELEHKYVPGTAGGGKVS